MNLLSSNIFRAAAVAIALPLLGLSVNVTAPTYTYSPGTGITGSSTTTSGDFSITSSYKVGAVASGNTYVDFFPIVTYTGSTPLATTTTVDVNLLATIFDDAASNWNGKYSETVPLLVAAGGSATGEIFVDGQGVGLISGGPGYSVGSKSATLTGLNGSTLSESYDFTFTFAAGTTKGALSGSPSPEPATMIPAAIGLAGFALVAIRRRKQ